MISFTDVSNYRGELQAKKEGGKYWWRVDSEIDEEEWMEIPEYLFSSLAEFHIKSKTFDTKHDNK